MSLHGLPGTGEQPRHNAMLDGVGLVILDFDGVIADSEVISLATLQETLSAFGVDLSEDDVRGKFLGRSLANVEAYLETHGPDRTRSGFADAWKTRLFDRFRAELKPMPQLPALLDHLSQRAIPYCIASSGTFERIGVALSAMRLAARFPAIFSAEQVTRGKPDPDLFLFASRQMGVRPETCLVIEDSPFGVQAAKSAGMRCIGFVGGSHLRMNAQGHAALLRADRADTVVASLDALFL